MISNEVIWLTGASSGIGQALAQKLAVHNRVIISARNEAALVAMAERSANVSALPFDVADQHSVARVQLQLNNMTARLDRVILNAGTCEYLDIEEPDWGMMNRVMSTNFFGVVNSVAVALPLLKKAANPQLIGISSQAINAPFIRAEAYGASKAAVHYLLDSLRLDLARYGIDVSEIQPGFVDTPLTQKNDFDMPFLMSADQASDRIINAIERRPMRYAFPKRLSALLLLARLLPRWWVNKHRDPENLNVQKSTVKKETVK